MKGPPRVHRLAPLLLAAACILAYSNSFNAPFILDDTRAIAENPRVLNFDISDTVRPVLHFTLAVNYALSGLNPADYRLTNVLIHVAACLVVFGLLRRVLVSRRVHPTIRQQHNGVAFASALLWGVHPLQTQSVTYVVQRAESLTVLCYLLALYAVARAARSPRQVPWVVLAALSGWVGIATKQIMFGMPLAAFLLDVCVFGRGAIDVLRRRWRVHVALASVWPVMAFLYASASGQGQASIAMGPQSAFGISPWIYLLTQCEVIPYYVRLALWPNALVLDYRWPFVSGAAEVWLGFLALAGAGAAVLMGLVRRRVWAFWGALFFIVLAPTSSLQPLPDAAFEHRMYLPLLSVVVLGIGALVLLLARLPPRTARWSGAVLTVLLATALGVRTLHRNADYADPVRMWRSVILHRPGNVRAHVNLAAAFNARGEPHLVLKHLVEPPSQLAEFQSMTHADVLLAAERPGGFDLMHEVVYYAGLHHEAGRAHYALKHRRAAVASFREAVRLARGYWPSWRALASTLFEVGEADEALLIWESLLKEQADDAVARVSYGDALVALHRDAEAIAQFEASLQTIADPAAVQLRIGRILASSCDASLRDGERALKIAEAVQVAVGGRYTSGEALSLKAAALAELGRYPEAVEAELAAQNLRLSRAPADPLEPGENRTNRVSLYRSGRAYRR